MPFSMRSLISTEEDDQNFVVLGLQRKGDLLGEELLFAKKPNYRYTVKLLPTLSFNKGSSQAKHGPETQSPAKTSGPNFDRKAQSPTISSKKKTLRASVLKDLKKQFEFARLQVGQFAGNCKTQQYKQVFDQAAQI